MLQGKERKERGHAKRRWDYNFMTYGNISSEYSVAIGIWKCILPSHFGR
jgi:hypothetical protein